MKCLERDSYSINIFKLQNDFLDKGINDEYRGLLMLLQNIPCKLHFS